MSEVTEKSQRELDAARAVRAHLHAIITTANAAVLLLPIKINKMAFEPTARVESALTAIKSAGFSAQRALEEVEIEIRRKEKR